MVPHEVTLAQLLAPHSIDDFRKAYWPALPFVTHSAGVAASRISQFPELAAIPALIQSSTEPVSSLHRERPAKEHQRPADAVNDYLNGHTCYLRHIQRYIAGVQPVLTDIAAHFGVPACCITAEMFCSVVNSGVAMHSDYDINFALLIRGEKRWRIARNEHIINQPGVCLPGLVQPHPLVRDLTKDASLPESMPTGSITITARPGTLLFLPRGWWHETVATGECIQINFVIKGPQLLDLLVRAISGNLARESAWREFAWDMRSENPQSGSLVRNLESLIGQLRSRLEQADDRHLALEVIRHAASVLKN